MSLLTEQLRAMFPNEPIGDWGQCAADAIDRLQATIDRLPKDADGNPVTPEDELVSTHYGTIQRPRRVCEIRAGGWRFYGSNWYEQGDAGRLCYGSTDAAEKARKP
jgi:hypothetical protein